MRALLDVNVLIALLDMDHVAHVPARDWLKRHATGGWASCPITQNGCVRIMSQPAYPNALSTSAVIERLARAARHPKHEFWFDDVSLLDASIVDHGRVLGPRQVTDLYLVALAVAHDGMLATFDGSIPISAIRGSSKRRIAVI
ncbi:MAG: VapC toxin family PIN domain ribonuclease [Deltaproteobacteria bacterium]|nr:VapC toxin family PIN domain ribonuclease [Deltaproteobacteria bacterium]